MSTTFFTGVELRTVNCWNCGATYALNEQYARDRQECGGVWHCPCCDQPTSYRESELAQTLKLLEQANSSKARLQSSFDQLDAEKRSLERRNARMMRRVRCGVCPCCKRTFQNLKAHMETKHPGLAKTDKTDKKKLEKPTGS